MTELRATPDPDPLAQRAATPAQSDRHLVAVWNPAYAADAMEAHLRVLLTLAARQDRDGYSDDKLYVWWGKVRSANRQQAQAHQDDIRRIRDSIAAGAHLYLTDYRSLYVGDLDEIVEGELSCA